MKAASSRLHVSSTVNTTGKIYERMENEKGVMVLIYLDSVGPRCAETNKYFGELALSQRKWLIQLGSRFSFFLSRLLIVPFSSYDKVIYIQKAKLQQKFNIVAF